jgi:hypothetical protein
MWHALRRVTSVRFVCATASPISWYANPHSRRRDEVHSDELQTAQKVSVLEKTILLCHSGSRLQSGMNAEAVPQLEKRDLNTCEAHCRDFI